MSRGTRQSFPNELGDPEKLDRLLLKNVQRDVFGASAFHGLDPSQMCMALEEMDGEDHASRERVALRCEIFSGFVEYLFADGPEPECVRARIEGFFKAFHPKLAAGIKGPREWVATEAVSAVLGKTKYAAHFRAEKDAATSRGALSTWVRDLEAEFDLECVWETIVALIGFMVSEGKTWKIVTAVAYCIAKSLRPHVLAGMSLEDIATLSGDRGRATPSHRGKRLISRRLAESGAKATHVHYQKSPEAVRKYSAAQMGNQNRAKKKSPKRQPSKKRKTTDPRKS
jgi:hypothetical protein